MIKACIIGISGYGRVHYELLTAQQEAGQVNLVGAAVINQEEEQERCDYLRSIGCTLYEDYTMMLQELSGIADLCCIPTGTPLHRMMTVAALEAGMHVFMEKPAAGCLADVQAMMDAEAVSPGKVAVGYQQLFDPVALELKQAVLEGRIGGIQGMKCKVSWPRNSQYYARNGWAGSLKAGEVWVRDSPMNNAVAHDLMMMVFLAGPSLMEAATPVSVTAELYRANAIESADTVCVRIETDTGIPLLFFATHASQDHQSPELVVTGTNGTLDWSHQKAGIIASETGRVSLEKLKDDLRFVMMDALVAWVEKGDPVVSTLDVAAKQTMVIEASHLATEIHPVDHEEVGLEGGATLQFIPGMLGIINDAFEHNALFSERDVPWARPGGTFQF